MNALRATLARSVRRCARDESGAAIIELVVMSPLLLLLLLGTIEVGGYMYNSIALGNAARAGVQYGAQDRSAANPTAIDASGANVIASYAQRDAADLAKRNIATTFTPKLICYCDSSMAVALDGTPARPETSCSGASTCALGDPRDVFIEVTATATYPPLVSLPGLPNPYVITRAARQQLSP
ncbi:MAG: hypothetical protein NVS2B3_14100 [Vulcanimicrobiaceae bacterium]